MQISSVASDGLRAAVGLLLGASVGVLTFLDKTDVCITKIVAAVSASLLVLGGTVFAIASSSLAYGAWLVFVCCGVGLYFMLTREA